jgi:ATP-dependent protease ClpP protease subunit
MAKINEDLTVSATDIIDLGLLKNHVHMITGVVDDMTMDAAIRWIVYENLDTTKDKVLTLYINSMGGSLTDAFALIDVMCCALIFAFGNSSNQYFKNNSAFALPCINK